MSKVFEYFVSNQSKFNRHIYYKQKVEDGEDLKQSVLFKLSQTKSEVLDYERYIKRSIVFERINRLRTAKASPIEQLEVDLSDSYLVDAHYTELKYVNYSKLVEAVQDLPKTQKLIMLKTLQNYNFVEISDELKLNYNTVKANYLHALKALRTKMKQRNLKLDDFI